MDRAGLLPEEARRFATSKGLWTLAPFKQMLLHSAPRCRAPVLRGPCHLRAPWAHCRGAAPWSRALLSAFLSLTPHPTLTAFPAFPDRLLACPQPKANTTPPHAAGKRPKLGPEPPVRGPRFSPAAQSVARISCSRCQHLASCSAIQAYGARKAGAGRLRCRGARSSQQRQAWAGVRQRVQGPSGQQSGNRRTSR